MFKPVHYHTLVDLAIDLIPCLEQYTPNLYRVNVDAAIEASKRHLPTPLTKEQVVEFFTSFAESSSPPFTESCLPLKIAFILHHTIVEDCGAGEH